MIAVGKSDFPNEDEGDVLDVGAIQGEVTWRQMTHKHKVLSFRRAGNFADPMVTG